MGAENLYEKIISGVAQSPHEPAALVDSGAVVPWRRGPDGEIEVYWVRRAEALRFMGGWYSFPGGGVSRRDADIPVRVESRHESEGGDSVAARLFACGARELFEEIGILVAKARGGTWSSGQLQAMPDLRRALLSKEIAFAEILSRLDVELDASRFVFAGRWITPESNPVRFDARFYLLEWPAHEPRQPEVIPGELDHGDWIRPRDALSRRERGEVLIPPPAVYILKAMADEGPVEGIRRLQEPQGIDLGPFRRMEFLPGCHQFPLRTPTLPPATHTNAYVLGNQELVLIDPGASDPAEIEALQRGLTDLIAEPGKHFSAIWLTHHHPDHVGGVEAMRRFLDAPVLAHPLTAERLTELEISVDRELNEGDRVRLQGEPEIAVEVLHTPGHARGHLCFYIERLGALVAGDIVAGVGTIVIDPPEGDMDDYLRSIERLIDLNPLYVLPGHGSFGPNGVGKLRELRDHRVKREAKVLEAWRAGAREPREMLPTVYADADPRAFPLAERQILAHLERLRKLGRIETTDDPR